MVNEKLISKIRKLLALSQSPNKHEAEAAIVAAFELMAKNDIEMSQVEESKSDSAIVLEVLFETGRVNSHVWTVSSILEKYFHVFLIRYKDNGILSRNNVIKMVGKKHRLELARHVYFFIEDASERSWAEYKKGLDLYSRRDTMYHKQSFMQGFMEGLEAKLRQSKQGLQEKGLVVVADQELTKYKSEHTKSKNLKKRYVDADTRLKGFEFGNRTDLFTPVKSGKNNLLLN